MDLAESSDSTVSDCEVLGDAHPPELIDVHVMEQHRFVSFRKLRETAYGMPFEPTQDLRYRGTPGLGIFGQALAFEGPGDLAPADVGSRAERGALDPPKCCVRFLTGLVDILPHGGHV